MINNRFLLISNQRCGSTWFITSLGNCQNFKTDFEIKWSKKLLIGKASPYHRFLKESSLDSIFKNFSPSVDAIKYGSKFVFDFYKQFPIDNYNNFLNKFTNYKIVHLRRDYLDILKSKLIGRVTHMLDKNNYQKNRLIDNTIFSKQEEYFSVQKKSKISKDKINFNVASSYLLNLFINDVLSLCLKRKNKFLSINYKEIKSNLSNLSYFLEVSLDDLEDNFFNKPVIKKNKIIYEDNFDNLSDLKKLNNKLENKIDELSKKKFKFNDIINFDSENKKLKINI